MKEFEKILLEEFCDESVTEYLTGDVKASDHFHMLHDLYEHYRLSYLALNSADATDLQMSELAVVELRLEQSIGVPEVGK